MLRSEAELTAALEGVQDLILAIDSTVREVGEPLEGNVLYMHHSFDLNPKNTPKQLNLFSLASALPREDAVIVEVGFNAGHSAVLMLVAHPTARLVAFDICEHAYTARCANLVSDAFPGRFELVSGRSQHTMPEAARHHDWKADLFHIDGDHDPRAARTDVENARALARPWAWLVFDDICFTPLKAVWNELLAQSIVMPPPEGAAFAPTTRHGIGVLVRETRAADAASEVSELLLHRGRMRHVLVLAPTDHGQDSLLGYLTKRRGWAGKGGKVLKLTPNTTERHQSPWLSLPVRFQGLDPGPVLVHLLCPTFHDTRQIESCAVAAEGTLLCVDCAEGLTPLFREQLTVAATRGLTPTLLMNKLDKLQALETDDEVCYQRLRGIVDEVRSGSGETTGAPAPPSRASHRHKLLHDWITLSLTVSVQINDILDGTPTPPLRVENGDVVFGRGSLSVAESIGGWGFTPHDLVRDHAARKGLPEDTVAKLVGKVWGEAFVKGEGGRERGFVALVLRPLRAVYSKLEGTGGEQVDLEALGAIPAPHLTGNARKMVPWPLSRAFLRRTEHRCRDPIPLSTTHFHAILYVYPVAQSALEAWLPLADRLLGAVVRRTPPPPPPPSPPRLVAFASAASADGRTTMALCRNAAPRLGEALGPEVVPAEGAVWLGNGAVAWPVPHEVACKGGIVLVPVRKAFTGCVEVRQSS